MTDAVLALIGGLVIGLVVVAFLARELVSGQVRADIERWQSRELYTIRRDALDQSRPEVQRRVGAVIAAWTHSFPFHQEDSRFIGHPIDYVVFEGYSAVRARQVEQIGSVTFVRARAGDGPDPESDLVRECIAAGRVEWRTLEIRPPQPELA